LLSIRDRQEAFHEFGINVSNASRANGLILEACLDIQRVARRIWQGNESGWHQLSKVVRHECPSTPVALAYPQVFATYTSRLRRRFNNVWKLLWTTLHSRSKFPGPFERRHDGFQLPLLMVIPLARYIRKMHHSFPRFFEDHGTALGDFEVSRYSRKSFTYDKSYSAMVPLPTWPLSERSAAPHAHPHSLPPLVFLRWRSRFPLNQGWLDSKSSEGIFTRVFRWPSNGATTRKSSPILASTSGAFPHIRDRSAISCDASRAFPTPSTFLDRDASLLRHRPSRLISYGRLLSLSLSPPFRKPSNARSIEFHFPHFHPASRSPSFRFGIDIISHACYARYSNRFSNHFSLGPGPPLLSFFL